MSVWWKVFIYSLNKAGQNVLSETNHFHINTNNKEKDGVIVPENDKLYSWTMGDGGDREKDGGGDRQGEGRQMERGEEERGEEIDWNN